MRIEARAALCPALSQILEQAAPRKGFLMLSFDYCERETAIAVVGVGKHLLWFGVGDTQALIFVRRQRLHVGNFPLFRRLVKPFPLTGQ